MAPGKETLAQYFTPPSVAAFALEALGVLGGLGAVRRVVDPACGDGVFLAAARERLPQAQLWGSDLDGGLAEAWRARGLVEPTAHLVVQDGLHDAPWYGLVSGTFDLVVGNPPYGFGVPRPRRGERIEALFLKRFVELARPRGWLAVIVPEGILANARGQRLRDWVAARATLRVVVALPEETFRASGSVARTALVVARRGRQAAGAVLLAEPVPGRRFREPGALEAYLHAVLDALRRGAAGD